MKNVILVTTTFYKKENEVRYRLAIDMMMKAKAAGYPVVVVDGSPVIFTRDRFQSVGAFVYSQSLVGMGASRRQAFFMANEKAKELGISIVLWLEPEKVGIVDLVDQIIEPIANANADIVLPFRSEKSWATYPAAQRQSEEKINAFYNEKVADDMLMGSGDSQFDPAFGPIAFHRTLARYFIECDGRNMTPPIADNYITQYAPLLAVLEENARVATVEVDFEYPPEQKVEEETQLAEEMVIKRRRQLDEITRGYMAVMKTLNHRASED